MTKAWADFVGSKWACPWCQVGKLSWRAWGVWTRLVAAELLRNVSITGGFHRHPLVQKICSCVCFQRLVWAEGAVGSTWSLGCHALPWASASASKTCVTWLTCSAVALGDNSYVNKSQDALSCRSAFPSLNLHWDAPTLSHCVQRKSFPGSEFGCS